MAATGGCGGTAMLVIDMQNDFVLRSSPVRLATAEDIVPNVIRAVATARERGILIVWVVREHDPRGRDVEAFRRHLYSGAETGPAAKGSKGAELVDGLVMQDGDYNLVKYRFSAFLDTPLHSILQSNGIKNLVITGIQTPNCIRETVYDLIAFNYESVTIITDAIASSTDKVQISNIRDMENVGAITVTSKDWCENKA